MVYELREGLYPYVDGQPVRIPRDVDFRHVSLLYGLYECDAHPIPIKVDAAGKLVIDLGTTPISIGAVEIRDDVDPLLQLNVVDVGATVGTNTHGLVIYGVDTNGKFQLLQFDATGNLKVVVPSLPTPTPISSFLEYCHQTDVAGNSEYTVITYTNTGTTLWLDSWVGSGTALGLFSFYVNLNKKIVLRPGSSLSVQYNFPTPFKVAVGDILDVKVLHKMPRGNFDASLIGHR